MKHADHSAEPNTIREAVDQFWETYGDDPAMLGGRVFTTDLMPNEFNRPKAISNIQSKTHGCPSGGCRRAAGRKCQG